MFKPLRYKKQTVYIRFPPMFNYSDCIISIVDMKRHVTPIICAMLINGKNQVVTKHE